MRKRILILGGSGYIGRSIYAQAGPERAVACWHRQPFPGGRFFDVEDGMAAPFVEQYGPFSHVLLLHGMTRLGACFSNPERAWKINVEGMISLIRQFSALGIKPVFTSSDQVFDGKKGEYVEDDPTGSLTLYGRQKEKVEAFLRTLGDAYAIIRLSKVYGKIPGDGSLFSTWDEAIHARRTIHLANDETLSPVLLDDVVDGLLCVVSMNLSGIFHLCGPDRISRATMFEAFLSAIRNKTEQSIEADVRYCGINDFGLSEPMPLNLSMNHDKWIKATRLLPRSVEVSACAFAEALYQ
jgi:dTDP-4-dehydrorhamnose reductase